MDTLLRDVRYGARTLLRSPLMTLVATLTLALGIGANTAIFSVVDGILFRSLPYAEPDRLVAVWADYTERDGPLREWLSYPAFADLRDRDHVFEDVAVYGGWAPTLTGAGEATSLVGGAVTAGMFSHVLRVAPALGRTFAPEDDRPGAAVVVVLSHGLWVRAFGGDASIVGRTVSLDGEPHTVIGVMPAGFRPPFIGGAEIWRPLSPGVPGGFFEARLMAVLRGIARLRPDVAIETARSEASALARRISEEYPDATGIGYALFPLRADIVAAADRALRVLLGAVGVILLIACVNVANLRLARGATRRGELAIRSALGASRVRLVRQLFTENILVAVLGGTLGFILALWGTQLLIAVAPAGTPRIASISVDYRVLGFTAAVTLLSGLAFGLLPALLAGRSALMESLKEGGRGADTATHGRRIQSALVVSQVALALTLLVGAGLLLRSFQTLNSVDLGFETRDRITLQVNLPASRYTELEQRTAFYTQLLERLGSLPGVTGAAATATVPMTGNDSDVTFNIEGHPPAQPGDERAVWYRRATPDYFDVMGIRLLAGRAFTAADDFAAPRVIIINETLAQRHFADRDPIGQRININDPAEPNWRQVIGVVEDVKNFGIRSDVRDALYLPYLQSPSLVMAVVLEISGDPAAMIRTVRTEIASLDPMLAATGIAKLDDIVSADLAPDRFVTFLLSGFAALALLLAAIGLYSVVSYNVTQRLREVGIRMALGAHSPQVMAMIVGRSMAMVGIGIVLGAAGAFFLTRLMEGLLYGVAARDPFTFVAVALTLTAIGGAAAAIPARKAARLDAMSVLRME
jgi:putative ABC transport system permease protein